MVQLIHSFAVDAQLKLVAILIAADFVLGVLAAVKLGTFRLSYVFAFGKDDVLGKVIPWFAIFAFGKVAPNVDLQGLGFGVAADGLFVLVTGAMVASILGSLRELGVPIPTLKGAAA